MPYFKAEKYDFRSMPALKKNIESGACNVLKYKTISVF